MFKKILFYGVTFILGIMALMTSYYGFYVSHNQKLTSDALLGNDYDKIAEIFIPFFNKDEYDIKKTENYEMVAYESVVGEKTTVTINDKEQQAYRYQESIVFFVNKINFSLSGVTEGEEVSNYTGLKFYNANIDEPYYYSLNYPVNAKKDDKEAERYFIDAADALRFFEIDLSTKIINEELGGQIDRIEVINGTNNVEDTIDLVEPIKTSGKQDGKFFTTVAPLVTTYDECLKANDGKRFNEFYQNFMGEYLEIEEFGITLSDKVRKPVSIYLKTGAVMLAFIAVAILIGYLLFKKKNKELKPYELDELMEEIKAEDKDRQDNEVTMDEVEVVEELKENNPEQPTENNPEAKDDSEAIDDSKAIDDSEAKEDK